MKLKTRLFYKLLSIALLFGVGLVIAGVIFPILNIVLRKPSAKQQRDWLKMLWLQWFSAIVGLRISQTGKPSGHYGLLVCNHISWLDIIVLGRYFPAYFVAKSDIMNWPVIGYLAKQGGTIFIRRGDKQQVKATAEVMAWHLKQKSMVIAFPEGTTTNGEDVLPFHASLFQPALLTKSAIHVVALQYAGAAKALAPFIGEETFIPHLIKMLSMEKIDVHIEFISSINVSGKSRLSLSNEARELISARIWAENSKLKSFQTSC